MVFGVSRPKRLSVVDVKEFGKARQELERRDVGSFSDGVRRCAHPLPETGERPLYAVSDCVGRELRHLAKPLAKPRQMFREDFAPDVAAYPCRGEICAGEDEGGHVAYARVGHHADVLAPEAGRARRPELQRERHGLASARAAGRDHAAVREGRQRDGSSLLSRHTTDLSAKSRLALTFRELNPV